MADEPTPPEGGSSASPEPTDSPRTFTQQELDRIVNERVNKSKAQFKDYTDLKDKAEKFDQLQAERQTEAEKLLAAVDKANTKAQEATDREQAATKRANDTLVRAAVIAEAATAGAADPTDVFALLVDPSQVTLGDDGQVTGVKEAVKATLEAKPHLVGRAAPGGFGGGVQGGAAATEPDMSSQIRAAFGYGR